jgi:formate hydrogenlyase subunit 6/NADH:ubiquinone oxidoreductase subunit I
MPLQSLDIIRRSATTLPEPEVRRAHTGQVAKLIDTTKCIGCKACQVRPAWNGTICATTSAPAPAPTTIRPI